MIARASLLSWTIVAVLPMLAACGKNDGERTDSAAASSANSMRGDSGAMGGVNGMMPPRGTDSMPAMPSASSMPGMSATGLAAMMPAHEMRITHLAAMHEEAMKHMK
jgi:hypothetical protein